MSPTLLRRMLNWPIVWRIAVKKATVLLHTQPDSTCLPCLAKARRERESALKCSNKKTPERARPKIALVDF